MADDTTHLPPPSLEQLFLAEESRLLHFATGLTGNFVTAQDIVQDAFLRLHKSNHRTIQQPRAWLFRTIRNLAHNHRRKHTRLESLNDAHELENDDTNILPADQLEHDEALLLMRLCLDEMAPSDRELVKLKFEDELSYDEISRRTGLTSGNVGYRLHHALKTITHLFNRSHRTAQAQIQKS